MDGVTGLPGILQSSDRSHLEIVSLFKHVAEQSHSKYKEAAPGVSKTHIPALGKDGLS